MYQGSVIEYLVFDNRLINKRNSGFYRPLFLYSAFENKQKASFYYATGYHFGIRVLKYLAPVNCKYCNGNCQKAGKQKNGTQKMYCIACRKYQQQQYIYKACNTDLRKIIPTLVCESVSIRGISRILKIGISTVVRKIKLVAASVSKPAISMNKKIFEMDEVRTYIRRKENQCWIAYALCSETKKVIDFIVGKRSKRTLRMVVNTLLLSDVEIIKTDKLNIYQSLIPANRHISAA